MNQKSFNAYVAVNLSFFGFKNLDIKFFGVLL